MSNSENCLFLGDLSFFCNEADLRKAFEQFGVVTAARIKRGKSKKNLSYGFIEFSSIEEAVRAMQAMDGVMFFGQQLRYVMELSKQK